MSGGLFGSQAGAALVLLALVVIPPALAHVLAAIDELRRAATRRRGRQ